MRLSCIAKVSKLLSSEVVDRIYYDMTSHLNRCKKEDKVHKEFQQNEIELHW